MKIVVSPSGAALHYDDRGDGRSVLALHGAYSTHHEISGFLDPVLAASGALPTPVSRPAWDGRVASARVDRDIQRRARPARPADPNRDRIGSLPRGGPLVRRPPRPRCRQPSPGPSRRPGADLPADAPGDARRAARRRALERRAGGDHRSGPPRRLPRVLRDPHTRDRRTIPRGSGPLARCLGRCRSRTGDDQLDAGSRSRHDTRRRAHARADRSSRLGGRLPRSVRADRLLPTCQLRRHRRRGPCAAPRTARHHGHA